MPSAIPITGLKIGNFFLDTSPKGIQVMEKNMGNTSWGIVDKPNRECPAAEPFQTLLKGEEFSGKLLGRNGKLMFVDPFPNCSSCGLECGFSTNLSKVKRSELPLVQIEKPTFLEQIRSRFLSHK